MSSPFAFLVVSVNHTLICGPDGSMETYPKPVLEFGRVYVRKTLDVGENAKILSEPYSVPQRVGAPMAVNARSNGFADFVGIGHSSRVFVLVSRCPTLFP